jgi:hypothetical protein
VEAVFPLLAFGLVLFGVTRSLGWGFVALFAVGYFNGVIRANYLSPFTTFMFDAGVLGLYVGFFLGRPQLSAGVWNGTAALFVMFLIGWPAFLTLMPVNDLLVQLVALRATVWFLPVLLVATRLTAADLSTMARGLAVLNLVAFVVGLYLYFRGIEALYPENAVTALMYRSKDVVGSEFHRVPSTFLNAHGYAGAMLLSLPFLLDRTFGFRVLWLDRTLAIAGVSAAVAGLLMSAVRAPLVTFAIATILAWVFTRFSLVVGIVALAIVAIGVGVALNNERFQRLATLEDTEYVTTRIQGSANEAFFELMADYPGGAGMGSSFGTSIPYFLADRAPEQIGLENEYSRILVDQGLIGLIGWLAFLGWIYARPPAVRFRVPWQTGVLLMYALSLTNWATAFIGTGTLASVPGAVLLLTQMGVVITVRRRGSVPA